MWAHRLCLNQAIPLLDQLSAHRRDVDKVWSQSGLRAISRQATPKLLKLVNVTFSCAKGRGLFFSISFATYTRSCLAE